MLFEMLDIVLNENENSHGIPKWFGRLIVALACFSFLVSLLQMSENKLDDGIVEQPKCLAIIRNLVQIVCVNFVFMVIRLDIFIKYKKEEYSQSSSRRMGSLCTFPRWRYTRFAEISDIGRLMKLDLRSGACY